MATAYRHTSAGENDELTIDGLRAEHKWIVEFAVGEDATDILAPVIDLVPIGAPHPVPDRFQGLICRGWVIGEQINERAWYVWVRYGPITDDVVGQWVRGGRFAGETIDLERSLAIFHPTDVDDLGNPVVLYQSQPIGEPLFVLADAAATPPRAATHKTSTGIMLHKLDKWKPGHLTINRGVTSLGYTITVPQLSQFDVKAIDERKWKCNDRMFLGCYNTWELMFSNFQFDDFVMSFGGTPGWFSKISVEILKKKIDPDFDPWGWRGVRRFQKWPDENGYAYDVFDVNTNIPVYNDWVTNQEQNFDDLFILIGGRRPAN